MDRSLSLESLAATWNQLGRDDPMWAVLTNPDKKGGRWRPGEFFARGRRWIHKAVVPVLEKNPIGVTPQRVLDFGCGVGRISQALAEFCSEVVGVDIAASMIEEAESYNRYPEKVRYVHNERPDLSVFDSESFDLVVTFLVLQHMPSEIAMGYLREFIRVLVPGGGVYLHIPVGRVDGGPTKTVGKDGQMSMFCTPAEVVRATLEEAGATIHHSETRPSKVFEEGYFLAQKDGQVSAAR